MAPIAAKWARLAGRLSGGENGGRDRHPSQSQVEERHSAVLYGTVRHVQDDENQRMTAGTGPRNSPAPSETSLVRRRTIQAPTDYDLRPGQVRMSRSGTLRYCTALCDPDRTTARPDGSLPPPIAHPESEAARCGTVRHCAIPTGRRRGRMVRYHLR